MRKSYIIGYFPWLMDSFNFFVWIVIIIICDFYCMQYASRLCFTSWMHKKKCMRTHEFSLLFKQSKQFLISFVNLLVMFRIVHIFTIFTIFVVNLSESPSKYSRKKKITENRNMLLNYACNFCYSLNRVVMLVM